MPTIQVDLIEVKQRPKTNNVIFTATQADKIITREIDVSEFDTWAKFAEWLINQEPEFIRLPDKEKSLSITFHVDEEGFRVLDSITVSN